MTETGAEGVEDGDVRDSLRVSTASHSTGDARADAFACADSNEMFVCGCCFVWEVTRGPHAGERTEFSTRDAADSTTLLRIGRHAQCWLRLKKDLEVSGFHAELRVETGDASLTLTLRDDKSTNGTKINGETAEKRVEYAVKHQDLLLFGRSAVRVSRGNTRCPEAQRCESQEAKHEPTEEPEPPQSKEAIEASSTAQHRAEERAGEERVDCDVCVVVREQHGDDDVFEEPVRVAAVPVVETPASRLLSVCMVCDQELSAWTVLEQQLHVNACLDRANGAADPTAQIVAAMTRPSTTSRSTQGKKRKRQQTTLSTQPQDEELAVALALSKSLVGKEQQVAMDMALVSSELAQVDAQLAKLQKKRVTLIKKLEKLEKAKRKVHTGEVRSPEETRALLDLSFALRVLFPEPRRVRTVDPDSRAAQGSQPPRESISRLVELYRGEQATMTAASGGAYVTMWVRASQGSWENETELFTNQLTRELLARAEKTVSEKTPTDGEAGDPAVDVDPMQKETAPATTAVPDVVKRVFPKWEENLAFLTTQSVEDLRSALEELQQTRAKRQMEKAMLQEDITEDGTDMENQDVVAVQHESSSGDDEDEEELACVFFEQEILRLIDEKERERMIPEQTDDDGEVSGEKDIEIVELMDSEDDQDVELDDRQSDEDLEPTTGKQQQRKKAEETPLSSDGDVDAASGENSPRLEEADAVPANNGTDDESSSVEAAQCSSSPARDPDDDGAEPLDALESLSNHPDSPQAEAELPPPTNGSEDDSLERKLLDALKANASLYEAVLLLQPLDLQHFLDYIRQEAGIKCAKTELVRFCDRHGITFKQS